MTATYEAATDEMFEVARAVWADSVADIVGAGNMETKLRYQGKEEPQGPTNTKYWARVSRLTVIEQQATLSTDQNAKRKYATEGLLTVQLFCPMEIKDDVARKGRRVAMKFRDAYRGAETPGRIQFFRHRIQELTPDIKHYRFNVIVEYRYTEIT